MATEDQQGMTPLTEQQAKALADWWGGDYQAMREVSGEDTAVVHGVVMPGEKSVLVRLTAWRFFPWRKPPPWKTAAAASTRELLTG